MVRPLREQELREIRRKEPVRRDVYLDAENENKFSSQTMNLVATAKPQGNKTIIFITPLKPS